MSPTRRNVLGGALALPALAVATMPVAATAIVAAGADARWVTMVADYRAKRTAWLATCGLEDDEMAAFWEARSSLGPEPQQPGSNLPENFREMTLAELRGLRDAPAHKAAWAAWERDHAAWKERETALRERMTGPAKATYDAAYEVQADAFNALSGYPVRSLADLGEKIELIAADYDSESVPQEYVADILADVRRLAGEARA